MTERVIWTDFGGVLTPPVDDALERVARAAGLPVDVLTAAMRQAADDESAPLAALELGRESQTAWGRRVTAALGPDRRPRVDLGRLGDFWYADRPLNRRLYDALVAWRGPGVRLGMLTNSVREWEPHRDAMIPDRRVFDHIVNSHEEGVRKPDPAIYRRADQRAGVPPANCLLIDDLAANCAAARARGWAATQHTDTTKTLAAVGEWLAGIEPATPR